MNRNAEEKNNAVETLIEISWEVCNKVGGINSVVATKAALTNEHYKNYLLVGPYVKEKAEQDFLEEEIPEEYAEAFGEAEEEHGIRIHYGTWIIKGEPKAILLEFSGLAWRKDDFKREFWEANKVDSLFAQWEFEEPMIFSYAAALLALKLEEKNALNPARTVFHSHEWMTGFAILKLKNSGSKIGTVFTTHATILGRSIAGNNQDLYGLLGKFNPEDKAREVGVLDKHTAEKAAVLHADVFTTVSEITGREAEFIHGRKPEVLVLNGLDLDQFPSIEETSIKHITSRTAIRELLAYTFFPYYQFSLEHNLAFYLAARYEFENKGIDSFIKALGMLNEELKKRDTARTISAFIFIAMPNRGVKVELLESKNYYRHIQNYVSSKSSEILTKIVNDFLTREGPEPENFFTKEFVQEMKKDVLRFKRTGVPVKCTHNLDEPEENNRIIQAFREANLNNAEEDKVKVLLFPAYLDGNDSLLNMAFYEVIAGTHLGVFPSYYEPWGYTPLESAALGVPSITSDLAGFGRFILRKTKDSRAGKKGVYVLKREKKGREEVTRELYEVMKNFALMDHAERVDNKIRAKELSHLADWKHLIKNYFEAHKRALENKNT